MSGHTGLFDVGSGVHPKLPKYRCGKTRNDGNGNAETETEMEMEMQTHSYALEVSVPFEFCYRSV